MEMVLAGVMIGSIYALLASGFVIVYKCTRVFNLAYPSLVLVGTYVSYSLIYYLHFHPLAALLCSIVFGFLLGFTIERLWLRSMIGEPILSIIILTIGLSELLKGLVAIVWGFEEKSFPAVFPMEPILLGNVSIPQLYLWMIFTSLFVFACLILFYRKSSFGIAMRAVACNQDHASLLGISPSRIFALSWGLSAGLGAVAGVFLAMIVSVNLFLEPFVLRSFPAAVLGGMDSVGGALVGGLFVGLSESFVGGLLDPYLGGGAKDTVAYVLLMVVLLVKPYGLFGTEDIERL